MRDLILLIEDNEQISYGNKRMLERRGYDVMTALTLKDARQSLYEAEPSLIVLDIMLPDGNGLDFLRELRQTSQVPVMILTGLNKVGDIVNGLTEGGDDYLTKPYDFEVLLARIEALIRRAGQLPKTLQKGPLTLNVILGQALLDGKDLLLTKKDFALLMLFTQNEGEVFSTDYLYEKIWKAPISGDTQAVKSAMSRLRKKLAGSGYTILPIRGEGYLFGTE